MEHSEVQEWKKAILIAFVIIAVAAVGFYLLFIRHHPLSASAGSSTGDCYTPDNVRDHEGQHGCVDFAVGYTYTSSKGNKFIDQYQDYSSGFEVYIPSDSSASGLDLSQYDGKNIEVTGDIDTYQGAPEIIVNDPSQIQLKQ